MPFHRLARLQDSCGVPLAESVQFERSETVADAALPVFLRMRELAADGDVIHTDDTRVRILDCFKQDRELEDDERRATQTSGMVVKTGEAVIALYQIMHHQARSGPVMGELREWIEKQFADKHVEPNSSLGQALRYVLKHWDGLTKFLSVAGAPLDNNLAERVLKRFVLMRKNSLFYKTEHGAAIGDILLSLIEWRGLFVGCVSA